MTLKRTDDAGIVVESLDTAITYIAELGVELEGRTMIEGELTGRVTGLGSLLARLRERGAQLVGEVVQYPEAYRLC